MNRLRWALLLMSAALLVACENGYQDGPFERWARAAMNGWDMWDTPAVRPYEEPQPDLPEGSVPTEDWTSLESGQAAYKKLSAEEREKRSALSYRRYCHHCHGANGDGRIIVGESHEFEPTDLRQSHVQNMTDAEIFAHVQEGGKLMLPLAATLSPLEILLVIDHVRDLTERPSTPYYKPQFTEQRK